MPFPFSKISHPQTKVCVQLSQRSLTFIFIFIVIFIFIFIFLFLFIFVFIIFTFPGIVVFDLFKCKWLNSSSSGEKMYSIKHCHLEMQGVFGIFNRFFFISLELLNLLRAANLPFLSVVVLASTVLLQQVNIVWLSTVF